MSIKQNGGVFGRNPTFNDVTIDGTLTFDGDIDINSDLKIDGDLEVTGTSKLTGNVGIGQAVGAKALEVTGQAAISGSVGIGTTAPNSPLTVGLAGTDAGSTISINSTTTGTGNLFFGDSASGVGSYSGYIQYDHNVDTIILGAGSAPRATLSSSGNLTVSNGNVIIGTSGKGIDFSATAGTGTSELLDDYEEGAWTPSQGAGLTVVGAFGSSGTYTKIGRQVTLVGTITGATSIACASGNVFVGNFPFNVGSYGCGSAFNAALNASTVLGSDGGNNMYSTTVINASGRISFTFTYFV